MPNLIAPLTLVTPYDVTEGGQYWSQEQDTQVPHANCSIVWRNITEGVPLWVQCTAEFYEMGTDDPSQEGK